MNEYLVTADIGKRYDPFVLFVHRKTSKIVPGSTALRTPDRVVRYLDLVHIEKFLGITYPQMGDLVATWMGHNQIVNNADLVYDGTGVGEAFGDILHERSIAGIPIIVGGGEQVREVYTDFGSVFSGQNGRLGSAQILKEVHVPKADLVAAGQLIAQQGRYRLASGLQWADDFQAQLSNFKGIKKDGARIKSAEAELEKVHDDFVSCYLLACWFFLREGEVAAPDSVLPATLRTAGAWDPYSYM
ncbi:MAG TPA: hypothetical protein PLB91_06990 [Spirochaetales bacterium]|nr:hypothetical protein [Spirochaetales bacterium]HRY53007.1 hypothetical protein [Spirochaetia bacterium]